MPQKGNKYTSLLLISGILILTFFLYRNSLNNQVLHFDDTEYFTIHPEVTHLTWQSLPKFFTSYYLVMYQPLPVLTLSLNYHFTGTDPVPFHLVNLLFHLVNILLVYRLATLLFGKKGMALAIALVFAIHPMNVEAVSWISARSSGMYTMFYLLALIFYVRYIRKDLKTGQLLLSFLFFVLALFSKSQAITLPLVLILVDYFYRRNLISPRVILEKIPFLILSAVFGWIALHNPASAEIASKGMLATYSPVDDLFMVCFSFAFYLVKFFIPLGLNAAYVYPPVDKGFLPLWYYLSPVLLAAVGYLVYRFRDRRFFVFGILFFFLTIFINIQVIPSRLVIVADRYAYVPYLGLLFLLMPLADEWRTERPYQWKKIQGWIYAVCLFYLVFFSASVVIRNETWNNDYVFMSDLISKNPDVPYLYRAYGTRGNWLKNQGRYEEALQDYSQAIRLKPDNAVVYANRALLYFQNQDFKSVISDADKAEALNYRSSALYQIRAISKFYRQDFRGALQDCDAGLKLDPTWADGRNIRTIILDSLNRSQAGH
ncbi:MAG TPA: tetratricopeptide repeat protein [Bacteroidales bacterium]|nr:tetratricopeptide repeat protein [Bacteroidales bacterium]